jgi:hypothetical protein
MTLEELYYISQIVAVVAILASLTAVYWQVRQANMIARAELTHSTYLQSAQIQASLYDTPEKADLMYRALRGTSPLSDPERVRVEVALAAVFGMHEGAFNLRQRNLIEAGAYAGQEALVRLFLRSPYAQAYWARRHGEGKDPKYVALLDGMVAAVEAKRAARATSEDPHP